MAKPRNRRKKSKSKRKSQQPATKETVQRKRKKESKETKKSTLPPSPAKKEKEKFSFWRMLYANDAEGLFAMTAFSPLFFGAWLAGGLILDENLVFVVLTAGIIVAHYTEAFRQREDIIFIRDLELLLYLAQAALLAGFYYLTQMLIPSVLVGVAMILVLLDNRLRLDSPFSVICSCVALVLRMSLFGILGILSQVHSQNPEVVLQHGVLGFVPGLVLASAVVAKNSPVFSAVGWQRSREITKKNGEKVNRPGKLTMLFSFLLVIGPAIPVAIAPLGLFPTPFLVCALAFFAVPKLAQSFLEKTIPDALIGVHTTNLAAALSLLVFIAGLLTKYVL